MIGEGAPMWAKKGGRGPRRVRPKKRACLRGRKRRFLFTGSGFRWATQCDLAVQERMTWRPDLYDGELYCLIVVVFRV